MAYQSAHTGQQIDEAVRRVLTGEAVGPPGADGKNGQDGAPGKDGTDGKDGFSPTVSTESADGGTTVTITDIDGPHTFTVRNGRDGEPGPAGQDGEPGKDGADGQPGEPGKDGSPGADGVSPAVSVSAITGGHRVTVTDVGGVTSFDVMDGKDGKQGPPGEAILGVTSFNDRSGAVTPQKGDYSAAQVSFTATTGIQADNVQKAIETLFQSGSEGKALVASAITAKGVQTAKDATFRALHDNILAISEMPDGVFEISLTADPPEGGTVSGGGYASAGMICNARAEAAKGYSCCGQAFL